MDYYCPFSLFTNMSGLIQRCISWTVSLFCILVLGNIIYELHVFSQENLGNHSDMAIRQNRNSESSEMFEMKQTDGSDEWDKFANFGKFERNRIFFLLYYNKQEAPMASCSLLKNANSYILFQVNATLGVCRPEDSGAKEEAAARWRLSDALYVNGNPLPCRRG